jgi:hypothetical protein
MPCIPAVDPLGCVGDAAQQGAEAMLKAIADQAADAVTEIVKILFTGWLGVDSRDVTQTDGTVAYLRSYTSWAVAAIAVGAVLVAAIRLALRRNAAEAGNFGKGLAWLVLLTGAGVPAVELLLKIGDSYSTWVVDAAADQDAANRILLITELSNITMMTDIAKIGVAMLMWLATLVQIVLMLGRGVALVLLAGLLPIAGAAGIGGASQLRNRYLSWLLALVLYKPTAATIYACAFWLIGKSQDFTGLLMAMCAFAMAIVALPALMRLLVPAVGTLTGGGGSGVAAVGALGDAGGRLASGAMRLAQNRDQGGGGGAPQGAANNPPPPPSSAPSGGSPGTDLAPVGAGSGGTMASAGPSGGGAASGAAAGAGAAGAGVMVAKKSYDAGQDATRFLGGAAASGAAGGGEGQ